MEKIICANNGFYFFDNVLMYHVLRILIISTHLQCIPEINMLKNISLKNTERIGTK